MNLCFRVRAREVTLPFMRHKQPLRKPRSPTPLGDLTPLTKHAKVLAIASTLRDELGCSGLSEQAVTLIAAKVNTTASTAKIAQMLGIEQHHAYVMLGKPEAQALMAQLAKAVLGGAALTAVHHMTRLMGSKDAHVAFKAADTMMERAGLGISQRSTPDGSTRTVFQFAFGAATAPQSAAGSSAPMQAEVHYKDSVDGTRSVLPTQEGASKNGLGVEAGEDTQSKLQPAEDAGPAQPSGEGRMRRAVKSVKLTPLKG